jgi:mono/diheme cytochrome c family protein/cytochrome bd-type quinol oxidase subunit 1
MEFPFWEAHVGYGPLMAVIAVLHVFLSHFAIGGGLYLVVAERRARKLDDGVRLAFLKRLSRFFVLATLIVGALTGVGIWFVIGLLSPAGTETLIHAFVWGWAIEWTFFVVEVLAGLLYYYGWERLPARQHMALGWVYFVFAWLSLVVINGILTFMLTPGGWLKSGSFWDGFLNPTYLDSLVLRTGICVLMAGLFALFVASRRETASQRPAILRGAAIWGLVGLGASAGAWWLYAHAGVLQAKAFKEVAERVPLPHHAIHVMAGAGVVLAVGLLLALASPRLLRRPAAVVLLLAGLLAFGGFEAWREGLRKPYVIHGFMWGNGIRVSATPAGEHPSLLSRLAYRTGDDGRDLFDHSCAACHQRVGYRSLKPALDGTDAAYITGMLAGLHKMRAPMPPFPGNAEERKILGSWLAARVDTRPVHVIHDLEGEALGRKVYEVRCSRCHVRGGFHDMSTALDGLDASDVKDLISDPELAEGMPAFSGDATDRDALIRYLLSWSKEKTR